MFSYTVSDAEAAVDHLDAPIAIKAVGGMGTARLKPAAAREPISGFDCASSVVPSSARGGLGAGGRMSPVRS